MKLAAEGKSTPVQEREDQMPPSEARKGHLTQLSIIGFAIVTGVVIFAGVVGYLLGTGAMPPEDMEFPTWIGTFFNVVALVALIKAQFIPRLFRRPSGDALEEDLLAWHKRTVIVGFALREAAALIALVGAMLTGLMVGAAFMVGLALLSMVMAWPREAQLSG